MARKILIVEDEPDIREVLSFTLSMNGFTPVSVPSAEAAEEALKESIFDMVLLDLMLPGMQGEAFCKKVRITESIKDLPIIIITAKDSEFDKIRCLELGADDFVNKPFSNAELIARIKAILRRYHGSSKQTEQHAEDKQEIISHRGIIADFAKKRVSKNGEEINLSVKEFSLLEIFLHNKGMTLSREQLVDTLWKGEKEVEPRTVDVWVKRLREKIGDKDQNFIKTIWGFGYRCE